jgi:mono/diheme cytochrome c family protein
VVVFVFGVGAAGQKPDQKPQVKSAIAIPIVSLEGKDNFEAYCAVCHGKEGKGNGPAAPAMKVPVADLTTIARRNKGQFIATNIEYIIRGTGRTQTPAHGIEDMPIWGEVFRSEDKNRATLRISNLVKYLESIQVQ